MRHPPGRRVLVVVLGVVLLLALAAATYATTVYSSHIVLHGYRSAGGRTLAQVEGNAPVRPAGVPQSAASGHVTLTGSTRAAGKAGPDLGVGGGTWTCDVWQYGWKYASDILAGYTSVTCNIPVFSHQYWPESDYCAPLLWGCTWQTKTQYSSCYYINVQNTGCPPNPGSENYNYQFFIQSGQLWRMTTLVCATPYVGNGACGSVYVQVKF